MSQFKDSVEAIEWLRATGNMEVIPLEFFNNDSELLAAANDIRQYFDSQPPMQSIPSLAVKHPYNCDPCDEVVTYATVDEFLAVWGNTDIDYNLCIRWDIHQLTEAERDPDEFEGTFHILKQRKGTWITCYVSAVDPSEYGKVYSYLVPHWETIKRIWAPVSTLNLKPSLSLEDIRLRNLELTETVKRSTANWLYWALRKDFRAVLDKNPTNPEHALVGALANRLRGDGKVPHFFIIPNDSELESHPEDINMALLYLYDSIND